MIFPRRTMYDLVIVWGTRNKDFLLERIGFFLVYTVLTIRQDMMDQTDENTDKQIKVP